MGGRREFVVFFFLVLGIYFFVRLAFFKLRCFTRCYKLGDGDGLVLLDTDCFYKVGGICGRCCFRFSKET